MATTASGAVGRAVWPGLSRGAHRLAAGELAGSLHGGTMMCAGASSCVTGLSAAVAPAGAAAAGTMTMPSVVGGLAGPRSLAQSRGLGLVAQALSSSCGGGGRVR